MAVAAGAAKCVDLLSSNNDNKPAIEEDEPMASWTFDELSWSGTHARNYSAVELGDQG